MTGPETLDVARDAIWTIVIVSSPLMVVGLVVGVVVSLFQALTQIQEQTLIYVPKILAIFATMLLALPFMLFMLRKRFGGSLEGKPVVQTYGKALAAAVIGGVDDGRRFRSQAGEILRSR